jgi:hypothetical protein
MPHFECGAFDHSATSPQRVAGFIQKQAAPHKVAAGFGSGNRRGGLPAPGRRKWSACIARS